MFSPISPWSSETLEEVCFNAGPAWATAQLPPHLSTHEQRRALEGRLRGSSDSSSQLSPGGFSAEKNRRVNF